MALKPRLDSALERLHWSNQTLARQLGCTEGTVRHWITGHQPTPRAVLLWLQDIIAAIEALPPPPAREWRIRERRK